MTLIRWTNWQLIICLPACSKFTVTFVPTIDCTWPRPQSGWSGWVTKSPKLKYNMGISNAVSCKPGVPQRRGQGNLEMLIAQEPITYFTSLDLDFLVCLCVAITKLRRWLSHLDFKWGLPRYQNTSHMSDKRSNNGNERRCFEKSYEIRKNALRNSLNRCISNGFVKTCPSIRLISP